MKQLKNILSEGILDDVDIAVDKMDKDLEASLNIPTKKDFERSDYARDLWGVKWYCPQVINNYKSKYPFIKDNMDGIAITCRSNSSHGKTFNIRLMYHNRTWINWYLSGWEIEWYDLEKMSLPNMKKLAIEIIDHLAHHPNAIDALFKQVLDYHKVDGMDYKWKDLRELLKIK